MKMKMKRGRPKKHNPLSGNIPQRDMIVLSSERVTEDGRIVPKDEPDRYFPKGMYLRQRKYKGKVLPDRGNFIVQRHLRGEGTTVGIKTFRLEEERECIIFALWVDDTLMIMPDLNRMQLLQEWYAYQRKQSAMRR